MSTNETWTLSNSGYSIVTERDNTDQRRIVACYPGQGNNPLNGPQYEQWLDDVERICDLYNTNYKNLYDKEKDKNLSLQLQVESLKEQLHNVQK